MNTRHAAAMTDAERSVWFGAQRIVVTGGTGTIGRVLMEQLQGLSPARLVSYARSTTPMPAGVEVITGDLLDEATLAGAVNQASLVFHLAGCKRNSATDTEACRIVNVTGTTRLLRACEHAGATVVMTSTAYVYGAAQESYTEDAPVGPASPYAQSKVTAELLVRDYARRSHGHALIARLANVYGGATEPDTVIGAALAQAGHAELRFRDLSPVRDFVHVRDVAAALLRLAPCASVACPVVNVGTGIGTSVDELANQLADLIARRGKRPRVSATAAGGHRVDRLVLDIRRLRDLTGWSPAVTLRSGLAELLEREPHARALTV